MQFLYDACNVKRQLYAKGLAWSMEEGWVGEESTIFFSFSNMFNSRNSCQPIFFNRYLSDEKSLFADNSRVEPTIVSMEKISYPLKLLSGHINHNPSLGLSEVLY